MNSPVISVIMPVYNGGDYLREAIDSIINQTYTDFEFIIINDGSSDNSEEIILSYSDERIRYVKNQENLQIVKTLNKGISLARGEFIARMDADDISISNRFEKQIEFMNSHPEISVCGSWIELFGAAEGVCRYPAVHEEIKAELIYNTALAHPSLLIRKSFFDTYQYEDKYNKAEDYVLWTKAVRTHMFANIPTVLLKYRLHNNQTDSSIQTSQADLGRLIMLDNIGCNLSDTECVNFNKLATYQFISVKEMESLWGEISRSNSVSAFLESRLLENALIMRYWAVLNRNTEKGLPLFKEFSKSKLNSLKQVSILKKIEFFVKCLFKK